MKSGGDGGAKAKQTTFFDAFNVRTFIYSFRSQLAILDRN